MFGKIKFSADVVVVGSGPGGATVARELSKNGKRVLVLERGHDHRNRFYYGTYLGALRYSQRGSLLFTEEGLNIIAPLMVGGATSMYCGCAAPPPKVYSASQTIIRHLRSLPLISAPGSTRWYTIQLLPGQPRACWA